MSRSFIAVTVCAALVGCVVSFDGYRAREENGDGNSGAGASGRGGNASGGSGDAGDGNAGTGTAQGGEPTDGGASSSGGDGNAGTPNGGADGSAGAVGMGGADSTCPGNLQGPALIAIPKPGGGVYCIDETEVRNTDYDDFLTNPPEIADQSAECSFNDSFDPEMDVECPTVSYDPVDLPDHPVTCIDWCDAKKYCEWAGKELCGAIAGGPIDPLDFADPDLDAWFSACTEHGAKQFPYGNSYQSDSCAGLDYDGTSLVPAGLLTSCEGGYPDLFDMSGNVSEWENSCDDSVGEADECLHRGGGRLDPDGTSATGQSLRCNSSQQGDLTPSPATTRRDMRHRFIGFRCCYVP